MKVLVSDPLAPEAFDLLKKAGFEAEARKVSPDELLRIIGQYDGLLIRSETKVTKAVIEAGRPRLKVVGRAGVGVDNVDLEAAKAAGVVVVNAPLAATNAVAELTLAQMLALSRRTAVADKSMHEGKWEKKSLQGTELEGKTLGLIGVGRIGARVAELARAFRMRVVAFDPYVDAKRAHDMGVEKRETVVEVVEVSDYVSVHTPLTVETRNLVNAGLLLRFKPGAFLLNIARGGVVDEVALAEAVRSGRIAGAALDVFAVEPLKDSPLTGLPQVMLTPHLGASTNEAQVRAGVQVVEQVLLALAGKSPDHRVV